jgi:hypothetical protein
MSAHYEQPLFSLEGMPLGAFHREIATLLADSIIQEARRIGARTGDKKEWRKKQAEFEKLKRSSDWFDMLVCERILQDAKR